MDKGTKQYRLSQISKLKNDFDYSPTIKIFGSLEGQTNCLNLSKEEFISICRILTEDTKIVNKLKAYVQ